MHWPGMHDPEMHAWLDWHAAPPGCVAAQTGAGVALRSQNRSFAHCDVDKHGAPTLSLAWQMPDMQ